MALKKDYSTVAIEKDVVSSLSSLDVDYYGISMTSNSDKISALIKLYQDNYKKPNLRNI